MRNKRIGNRTMKMENSPTIISTASIVGPKEGNGPLKDKFDVILQDDLYGDYLSKESLASNMEGVRGIGQKGNISSGKRNIESFPEKETSIFDIDKAINGNLT